MDETTLINQVIKAQPYPLIFVIISGAHLYGFPSKDSDYDLRGVHILPLPQVLSLKEPRETIELLDKKSQPEMDLVTHDIKKYIRLLLNHNGYVLEHIFSPLVVHTTPEHDQLKTLAKGCIAKNHYLHYLGFATQEWKLFQNPKKQTVKRLLYIHRVLLTGRHLMETGEVLANLVQLNKLYPSPLVDQLVRAKISGAEQLALKDVSPAMYEKSYQELSDKLKQAAIKSKLPEQPTVRAELDHFLVSLRLKNH